MRLAARWRRCSHRPSRLVRSMRAAATPTTTRTNQNISHKIRFYSNFPCQSCKNKLEAQKQTSTANPDEVWLAVTIAMTMTSRHIYEWIRRGIYLFSIVILFIAIGLISHDTRSSQQEFVPPKVAPFTVDLYHKFSLDQEFKPRGSILVKPKTEFKAAQATIVDQVELTDADLDTLKSSSDSDQTYHLKAIVKNAKSTQESVKTVQGKTTQTLVKSCSLYNSNLADHITINLSPLNEFISVNIFTEDPECAAEAPHQLSKVFNTTVLVDAGVIGPSPDTATYIKRLEEERQNKLREGKEDNRSFFAKYWIYIVPAVIILMVFSGPEQGAR